LTWNVLFDLYDKELIFTELRVPRLLAALRDANADIITLQEVKQYSFFFFVLINHSKLYFHQVVMVNGLLSGSAGHEQLPLCSAGAGVGAEELFRQRSGG
jgi:hypothetical protein